MSTPRGTIPSKENVEKIIYTRVGDPNLLSENDIPKEDWFSPFVPVKPDNAVFQPVNGDVKCDGKLLKGAYEKGTGTDLNARRYMWHLRHHQKNCHPQPAYRKPV